MKAHWFALAVGVALGAALGAWMGKTATGGGTGRMVTGMPNRPFQAGFDAG